MGDTDTGMRTETWLDRTGWDVGPWDDEPDRAEWEDPATGLPCLALRHSVYGIWCGYVAVPPGHRWHGRTLDDLPEGLDSDVNFAEPCMDDADVPRRDRVCHVPAPGEPDDVWWFGFDCGHAFEVKPHEPLSKILGDFPNYGGFERTYRTLDYVRDRCARLASQAAQA
jgi:hypothetical protein